MPTPISSIEWPATLDNAGPAEDPTVILTGTAKIAGVPFVVTAVRRHTGRRGPDYRADVPQSAYSGGLDAMVDDVEDLGGSMELELLMINGASYLMWMVPKSRDGNG